MSYLDDVPEAERYDHALRLARTDQLELGSPRAVEDLPAGPFEKFGERGSLDLMINVRSGEMLAVERGSPILAGVRPIVPTTHEVGRQLRRRRVQRERRRIAERMERATVAELESLRHQVLELRSRLASEQHWSAMDERNAVFDSVNVGLEATIARRKREERGVDPIDRDRYLEQYMADLDAWLDEDVIAASGEVGRRREMIARSFSGRMDELRRLNQNPLSVSLGVTVGIPMADKFGDDPVDVMIAFARIASHLEAGLPHRTEATDRTIDRIHFDAMRAGASEIRQVERTPEHRDAPREPEPEGAALPRVPRPQPESRGIEDRFRPRSVTPDRVRRGESARSPTGETETGSRGTHHPTRQDDADRIGDRGTATRGTTVPQAGAGGTHDTGRYDQEGPSGERRTAGRGTAAPEGANRTAGGLRNATGASGTGATDRAGAPGRGSQDRPTPGNRIRRIRARVMAPSPTPLGEAMQAEYDALSHILNDSVVSEMATRFTDSEMELMRTGTPEQITGVISRHAGWVHEQIARGTPEVEGELARARRSAARLDLDPAQVMVYPSVREGPGELSDGMIGIVHNVGPAEHNNLVFEVFAIIEAKLKSNRRELTTGDDRDEYFNWGQVERTLSRMETFGARLPTPRDDQADRADPAEQAGRADRVDLPDDGRFVSGEFDPSRDRNRRVLRLPADRREHMGWILAMPRDSYASESGFRRLQEEIRRRPPSPEEPAARPYTERDRRAQGRQGARVVPTPVRNDRIREVTRIVLEEIAKENLWFPPGPPP